MVGTFLIVVVVGLILAVGAGRFVKRSRAQSNGSWEGSAAVGSVVALVGMAMTLFALLGLFGELLFLY